MKTCDKDNTPCLHAACLESQGVDCCRDCEYSHGCTTACSKAVSEHE